MSEAKFVFDSFLRHLPAPDWPKRKGSCGVTGMSGRVLLKSGSNGDPDAWIHEHVARFYPRYKTVPKQDAKVATHANAGSTTMAKFGGAALVTAKATFVTFNLKEWQAPIQFVEFTPRDLLLISYYDTFPSMPRPDRLRLPVVIVRPFAFLGIRSADEIAANLRCTYDDALIDVCGTVASGPDVLSGLVRIDIVNELHRRAVPAQELTTFFDRNESNSDEDCEFVLEFTAKYELEDLWENDQLFSASTNEIMFLGWLQSAEKTEARRQRKGGMEKTNAT